ncbi:putative hydrolase or acyltransferase of alpha/beta superfamily [Spongiibacter sp. IMCC21906]|uniref:alpha/beta fold hydrolase n=1 Tax=Spongiibacter sp. IMCC21906 TaxID=1620392 RepID=UPI00062DDC7C|nr:alpha/beta fold hydrolase [Spongiibacter sp. IMCC21906]AKH68769.1 putative hydrolase or acyltransferase of alpha/beta superfamily [Spongiibacter sp. IMCC21906]
MATRKFEVDPIEYPFKSHWYNRNGVNMHYIDEGSGVPVVMCHGNPTWSFLYRKIIKLMAGKCRCIAYDLPGFGMSDHPQGYGYTPQEHAEWLEAFLIDHLQLDNFILVMQDWGGPTSLSVATRHPERIAGLVISNTWAWETTAPVMRLFSKALGNRFSQNIIRKHNIFAKYITRLFCKPMRAPNIFHAYTAPFPTPQSREGTAVFPYQIVAANPWLKTLEADLGKLKGTSVEFIFAGKDPICDKAAIQRWLGHFPDAGVQMISKAGHYIQEENPEAFELSLDRLLNKLD